MTAIEICLMIVGIVMFIGSFFIAEKLSSKEIESISQLSSDEISRITERELKLAETKVEESLEEILEYVREKAERKFEKITNEKMITINEYSDTVLDEINKNHKEVVFLYSMLCDKQKELKILTDEFQIKIQKEKESYHYEKRQVSEEVNVPIMTKDLGSNEEEDYSNLQETREIYKDAPDVVSEESFNNNQMILDYYQQGKAPIDIARDLGLGYGEVKLVIDLFKGDK